MRIATVISGEAVSNVPKVKEKNRESFFQAGSCACGALLRIIRVEMPRPYDGERSDAICVVDTDCVVKSSRRAAGVSGLET